MEKITGISVSTGIACAPGFIIEEPIIENDISYHGLDTETAAVKASFDFVRKSIERERQATHSDILFELFESYGILLDDEDLVDEICEYIENEECSAGVAIDEVFKAQIMYFSELKDNEYLAARASDLAEVKQRLLLGLTGQELPNITNQIAKFNEPVILIGRDLSPALISSIDRKKIAGVICEESGVTSHLAIISRGLGIPTVVLCAGIIRKVKQLQEFPIVCLDEGFVVIEPDNEYKNLFYIQQTALIKRQRELEQFKSQKSETQDGHSVVIAGNIGSIDEIIYVKETGLTDIGLFRTEFIFMHGNFAPTEDAQYAIYKQLAENFNSVIIRSLDVGGDKAIAYLNFPPEANPFLGWRGLRYCLDNEALFYTQLRAIIRASISGSLRLMLPMVTSYDEVIAVRTLITRIQDELSAENIAFDKNMPIGIMVETPAAVFMLGALAPYIDFVSIGSNDLTQYVLCVDRGNSKTAHLYESYHPAVLQCINQVVNIGQKHNFMVGLCGEFGANIEACELLVGLGLNEISVSSSSALLLKERLRSINYAEAVQKAQQAIQCKNAKEVKALYNIEK